MQISSKQVGTPLRPVCTKIHWRETMNYAAAISDDNPLYFDDERSEGIIAPPMFIVAVTWPIIANLAQYLEPIAISNEVVQTLVHYSEHIRFHRPIRPDDELTIQGQIAAVLPHRAGTYMVVRFDAVDAFDQKVFTEYTGAMLRGVQLQDDGKGGETLPRFTEKKYDGSILWQAQLRIDPMLPFIYDGCTGIMFPIHTSKKFARQVGLPDIILQGTATLALAVRELINREAKGNPFRLKELACRFTGMVFPADAITLSVYEKMAGEQNGALYFDVLNAAGQGVISKGFVLLAGAG
jgi:acyl dehydratase